MTKKQSFLYFREWNRVREILIAANRWDHKQCEAARHQLMEKALGYPTSSKDLTSAELDIILGVFRSISGPDDIEAQLAIIEQPIKRSRHVLDNLAQELNLPEAYLNGMAKKINKKPLKNCNDREIHKLIAALNYHKRRQAIK